MASPIANVVRRHRKSPEERAALQALKAKVDEEGDAKVEGVVEKDEPTQLPPDVAKRVRIFNRFFKRIGKMYFEREDELLMLKMALLTRQHCLFVGPHGLAKSEMVFAVFRNIVGAPLFDVELTKFDGLEVLFGPTSVEALRKEDTYKHNVKGMLPDSTLAILEELFDANKPILRSALQVLNERRFTRGQFKVEECPLWSACGTSNFYDDDDEALKAVIDRFLFRCTVRPIQDEDNRMEMYRLNRKGIPVLAEPKRLQWRVVTRLHEDLKKVTFDDDVCAAYDDLVEEYNALYRDGNDELLPPILDRRARWIARGLLQSAALLNGRLEVTLEDLEYARLGMCMVHRSKDDAAFREAHKRVVNNRTVRKSVNVKLSKLTKLIVGLESDSKSTNEETQISTYTDCVQCLKGMQEEKAQPSEDKLYNEKLNDLIRRAQSVLRTLASNMKSETLQKLEKSIS